MLSLPTPLNVDIDHAGVAVGGEGGYCQEGNRQNLERLPKGKEKVDDQEFFINEDRKPPDKIDFDNSQQVNIKKSKNKKLKVIQVKSL